MTSPLWVLRTAVGYDPRMLWHCQTVQSSDSRLRTRDDDAQVGSNTPPAPPTLPKPNNPTTHHSLPCDPPCSQRRPRCGSQSPDDLVQAAVRRLVAEVESSCGDGEEGLGLELKVSGHTTTTAD